MLTTSAPRPSRAEAASAPNSALVSRNGADQVDGQRLLQRLALGVGQQRQRHRPEARRVVDQHVEPAEAAGDLQRDRVDVVLAADVADDAVRAGRVGGALDGARGAGDEGDARAVRGELPHQRQAEAGGAAGDGDAQPVEIRWLHACAVLLQARSTLATS